jgi:hypothetical protein
MQGSADRVSELLIASAESYRAAVAPKQAEHGSGYFSYIEQRGEERAQQSGNECDATKPQRLFPGFSDSSTGGGDASTGTPPLARDLPLHFRDAPARSVCGGAVVLRD